MTIKKTDNKDDCVSFSCQNSNCDKVMHAPRKHVGLKGKCPRCSTVVVIQDDVVIDLPGKKKTGGFVAGVKQRAKHQARRACIQKDKQERRADDFQKHLRLDLDTEVLRFGNKPWSVRELLQHVAVIGATGAGKTSGFRNLIFTRAVCELQMGCFAPCVKSSDADDLEAIAQRNGAGHRVKRVTVGGDRYFMDFMAWELERMDGRTGTTFNICELLIGAARAGDGAEGNGGERFWEDKLRELLMNAIDLSVLAEGTVSLDRLKEIIRSAPRDPEEVHSGQWKTSLCHLLLQRGHEKNRNGEFDNVSAIDFDETAAFFLNDYPRLNPRTRTSVEAHWGALANTFRGEIREIFAGGRLTCRPEETWGDERAIIIIDVPIDRYVAVGKTCQILAKRLFQRAVVARQVEPNMACVLLLCDEYDKTSDFPDHDSEFASYCREKRCACVLISQSADALFSAAGGSLKAEHLVGSLAANLSTKLFFRSTGRSAQWASDQIGKTIKFMGHASSSLSGGLGQQTSGGGSQSIVPIMLPAELHNLRTGGPLNNNIVEAIVFMGGESFENGSPIQKIQFEQIPGRIET